MTTNTMSIRPVQRRQRIAVAWHGHDGIRSAWLPHSVDPATLAAELATDSTPGKPTVRTAPQSVLPSVASQVYAATEPGGADLHVIWLHYAPNANNPVADPEPELPSLELPGPEPTDFVDHLTPHDPQVDGIRRVQRLGAYAIITHHDAWLLAHLPSSDGWTLPGGGVDFAEQPVAALQREVYEETGLRVLTSELMYVTIRHFTGHAPSGSLDDFHAIQLVYRAEVDPSDPVRVIDVGGTTDAASWIPLSELDQVALRPTAAYARQHINLPARPQRTSTGKH